METKARKQILGITGRMPAARRLAVVAALTGASALAGCGGTASTREPVRGPSLADRLDRMSGEAQLDTLRVLTRANPGDATLVFHTGNAYYTIASGVPAERHDQAIAYFDSAAASYRRATEIDTTYSKAFVNMGLALDAAEKRNEARAALQRAIAINPRDVLAYCHLGYLEHAAGNRAEAVRLYQRALAVDPNSAQAHYNLGLAFAEAKIFREALAEWERVVALDPDGELGRTAADNVRIIRTYLAETP